MKNKTVAAISTPLGPGGIGIIRISGPKALTILKRLFIRKKTAVKNNKAPSDSGLCSHHVYYGHIHELNSASVIDEVLAIFMKSPKSFTCEDVVEIHSHSGYVLLNRILSAVVDAGAELAEPGEFTKRAFLNGRIDLTQAEAVIDLINAPCETAAKMASHQVSGAVKDAISKLINSVTALQARCEAMIEFDESEDMMNAEVISKILRDVNETIRPEIADLIQRQRDTAIFHDGVLLAIVGAPNVGKSSLLNQLVEKETAIVSEVPGTTRDVIREYHSINGVPVIICDTAGIHDTLDPVECIGIERARNHLDSADIVLMVIDASRSLNQFEEKLIDENKSKQTIVVVNKSDIAAPQAMAKIENKVNNIKHIVVSAKSGDGIDALKNLIFRGLVIDQTCVDSQRVTPNLRQRKLLEKVIVEIRNIGTIENQRIAAELASEALGEIRNLLEMVSGNKNEDDLYDHLFSQFCIGK